MLFLFFFLIMICFHAVILAVAVGEGYLLYWLVPGMEVPMAIFMGLLTNLATILYLLLFSQKRWSNPDTIEREDSTQDEEQAEESGDEEDWDSPRKRSPGQVHFDWEEFIKRGRRKKKR
jgi:membrane protein implicated in regulation of membrane protease activity